MEISDPYARTLFTFFLSLSRFGFLMFLWVSYLAYPNLLGKKALMLLLLLLLLCAVIQHKTGDENGGNE
jgi:hypothetical protein